MPANTEVSHILMIDRQKSFNPAEFIYDGWAIEEQDERSLALTEIDLTAIHLESMLEDGETLIKGEERLRRLKTLDHIRLDALVFQTLWENQHLIPSNWKKEINGDTPSIEFDGTIFRSPDGSRCVLSLFWFHGQWCRSCHYLWPEEFYIVYLSAVL